MYARKAIILPIVRAPLITSSPPKRKMITEPATIANVMSKVDSWFVITIFTILSLIFMHLLANFSMVLGSCAKSFIRRIPPILSVR